MEKVEVYLFTSTLIKFTDLQAAFPLDSTDHLLCLPGILCLLCLKLPKENNCLKARAKEGKMNNNIPEKLRNSYVILSVDGQNRIFPT